MSKKLTKKASRLTQADFIKKGGMLCPFCKSSDLDSLQDNLDIDFDKKGHPVSGQHMYRCLKCDKEHTEHYTIKLTGYSEIEEEGEDLGINVPCSSLSDMLGIN